MIAQETGVQSRLLVLKDNQTDKYYIGRLKELDNDIWVSQKLYAPDDEIILYDTFSQAVMVLESIYKEEK